jgi:hypothetical protein
MNLCQKYLQKYIFYYKALKLPHDENTSVDINITQVLANSFANVLFPVDENHLLHVIFLSTMIFKVNS